MNRRRFGFLVVGMAILTWNLAAGAALAAEPCVIASGQSVVLMSSELDPSVFIFDTHQRAGDWAGGFYKSASELMSHTTISPPGTRAIVIACIHGAAQTKFRKDPLDVIGLRIVSGPDRGHYGWVTADDVHLPRASSAVTAAKGSRPQPQR